MQYPQKPEEGVESPGIEVTDDCKPYCLVCAGDPILVSDSQLLGTEPFLQGPLFCFCFVVLFLDSLTCTNTHF